MGCEEVECYSGMPVENGGLPTTAQTNLTNTDRKLKSTSFTAHFFLVITPASDNLLVPDTIMKERIAKF
jgi:hypothetical protein